MQKPKLLFDSFAVLHQLLCIPKDESIKKE